MSDDEIPRFGETPPDNKYIDEITMKLMSNKTSYAKYLSKTDNAKYEEQRQFKEDCSIFKKDIAAMTKELLLCSDNEYGSDVNDAFNNYSNQNIAQLFKDWNNNLNSYLIDISTQKILEKIDDKYLIEKIDDLAGDNGTGRWMLNYGIELGSPLSMLSSAMDTRFISRFKTLRKEISEMTNQRSKRYTIDINSLKKAYQFCRHINFIQAFCLINASNKKYGWNISISKALNVWSNGSIIKSSQINDLYFNYSVENILSDKKIIKDLNEYKPDIINVILISLKNDISIPCFGEALNYFNSISTNEKG